MGLQALHLSVDSRQSLGLLLGCLSAFILYHTSRMIYRAFFGPLSKFPGPRLAALSEFWQIYHTIKCDKFRVIHALHQRHGDVVRIGPNELSFASPGAFYHIFVANCAQYPKSDFYKSIQPGVGPEYSGLFNYTDYQTAQSERKDLQSLLSPAKIRSYENRYDVYLKQLVEVVREKDEVDLFKYLKFLMLDVIGDLSFNQSFGQLSSGEEHTYVIDFNNAFMLIGLQNTFAAIIPSIPYLPFQALKDAYFGLQRVFAYSTERINEWLELEKAEKEGSLMSAYLDGKTGQPKPPYSAWTISLSGHGFIVAGSEASSITLTYIIWNLIKHVKVDKRLREELKTQTPGCSYADLIKLPYLEAVVRETMRVFPPAPSPMPRVAPANGAVIEGTEVPAHTIVSAQPYTVLRSEAIFEKPEVFMPERWLNASKEKKEQMLQAFIPFSAGQRGCIGRGLAWMHLLKGVATILENFESFELLDIMTDDDMQLVERGALAKPKSTKLWVKPRARLPVSN